MARILVIYIYKYRIWLVICKTIKSIALSVIVLCLVPNITNSLENRKLAKWLQLLSNWVFSRVQNFCDTGWHRVSSSDLQNVQSGESASLRRNKNLRTGSSRWISLVWNHLSCVSVVDLKTCINIFSHCRFAYSLFPSEFLTDLIFKHTAQNTVIRTALLQFSRHLLDTHGATGWLSW